MGNTVSTFVHNAIAAIKDTMAKVFWQIAPPIVRYVINHPVQTLFHVGKAILILVPGVSMGPLLGMAGFTNSGIAAHTIAAVVQSAMGAVRAGDTFALLQSAAMGGYGVANVRAAAGGVAIAVEALSAARRAGRD